MRTLPGIRAVLLDLGATLVAEAPPATPTAALEAQPLPGVVEAVEALAAAHALAIVTNTATMGEGDVRALLAPVGLDAPFAAVVASAEFGVRKPEPAPLLEAAERLGIPPSACLYIGDLASDAEAAAAAGMAFVATDGGLGDALDRAAVHLGSGPFVTARSRVRPVDAAATAAAVARLASLATPTGALGHLEDLGIRLAAMAGVCPPPVPEPAAVAVFAGDHGVVARGVTPWPSSVTAAMVRAMAGGKATINVFARQVDATVTVVDVGVADDLDGLPRIRHAKVRAGTADLAAGPAMSVAELSRALDVGAAVAADLVAGGARCLVTGEMGIGNTTSSAAVIAALTGRLPADVVGRGTGIDDQVLETKVALVTTVVERTFGWLDPLSFVREIGGLELAALAGFIVGGAADEVPVVIDGVTALAALLFAESLVPGVADRCIAGHRSTEPGASAVLDTLGLHPVLDLELRLGEGTGACLAVPIVQAAARLLTEVATIDEVLA